MTAEDFLSLLSDLPLKVMRVREKYPIYSSCLKNVSGYKTRAGNLAYRQRMLAECATSKEAAHREWIRCRRDVLYYINTYCYTYDPRLSPKSTVVPFITYNFQDMALDDLVTAIDEDRDMLIEKSRDMGASWMSITVLEHKWHFYDYQAIRAMSRTEDLVDKTDDPDALFWKVDFILEHLPSWLAPRYKHNHLHFTNRDGRSTLDGMTTASDAGRGGRCGVLFIDEFAAVPDDNAVLSSTRDTTTCRLFNSTHQGAATAFYKLSKGRIPKLILHWSLHPAKQRGLYMTGEDGKVRPLDKNFRGKVKDIEGNEYDFPFDYPFRLDGKMRSPWYDNECDRAAHPMEIAQELDIDPFSSDFQYFDAKEISLVEKRDCRTPFFEGDLEFDPDSLKPLEFVPRPGGPLKLWVMLDAQGNVSESLTDVVFGIDVSAGTGASNSAITGGNARTGEKILEYANPNIKPESFAAYTYALANAFNQAFLVWDAGGPGGTFGDTIIELGYRNVYYKRNELTLSKKVTDTPGFFLSNKDIKRRLIGDYRRALKAQTFIQRSRVANEECLSYIYTTRKTIEHSAALNSVDPSGAGDSHGDRVIADALCNKGMKVMKPDVKSESHEPQNCYAARQREWLQKQKAKERW